jgi:hypothetical protein
MNVELFWTGTALMAVWQIVSYLRLEIQEFFVLRQFDKWTEEFEEVRPVKKVAKKK